jgi:hypothetical protein
MNGFDAAWHDLGDAWALFRAARRHSIHIDVPGGLPASGTLGVLMTEGSRSSTAGGLLALLLPSFTRRDPGMGGGLDVRDELGNRVPSACVRGHVGVASTCRSIPGVAGDAAAGMGGPSSIHPWLLRLPLAEAASLRSPSGPHSRSCKPESESSRCTPRLRSFGDAPASVQ